MSKLDVKAYRLKTECTRGYWQDRILFQIKYAIQLSDMLEGKYDALIEQVEDFLLDKWEAEKIITPEAARQAEKMLLPISADAKAFTLHCVSHAHIDMNWMWRFDETVSITLDTFRTMLDLLEEYPQFTFSQSQASVYKIVEDYGPAGMLESIKKYVREGRWEVIASTWVEADKNTPNGESMARHLLYTRRYLSRLLEIPFDQVRIDFEPDTFGHSEHVPAVLAKAGVEYYYHCRGSLDPQLIWWQAPSGERVLSFQDSNWYGSKIGPDMALQALPYCKEQGIDSMLKVYGVGDHGGGPSRRDIERIIDMQGWPVFPTLLFSTYHAFFDDIKARFGSKLPVRDTEMNVIFTGCYTSQARIKMANRIGEATLHEAELFGSLAYGIAGFPYSAGRFETAWREILFNQFHDILPGSGVIDTREYAMGEFQKSMATANTEKLTALRAIAARIDTSRYAVNESLSQYCNEGAGTGFGTAEFKISQVDCSSGSVRIYHVFNAAPYKREGLAELTVWDCPSAKLPLIEVRDEQDRLVTHQMLNSGTAEYWGHEYVKLLIPVQVPACGWSTYIVRESADSVSSLTPLEPGNWLKVEAPHLHVLENEHVRVQFDTSTARIVSFIDKKENKEWIKPGCSGGFRLITEDTDRNMTSWLIGRYINIREFDTVFIRPNYPIGAALRQSITIKASWSRSTLTATFSLDSDSRSLQINANCDWGERGGPDTGIPQLNFSLPLADEDTDFCYDIPMGVMTRKPIDMDMPGNSFITALPSGSATGLMLSADTKYGFRGISGTMSVSLIRSSYEPDPVPEYGQHNFKLAIGPVSRCPGDQLRHAFDLWHPFNTLASTAHGGELPLSQSLLELDNGDIVLQGVKMAEDDGNSVICRLYNAAGQGGQSTLRFHFPISESIELVDLNERTIGTVLPIRDNTVTIDFKPYELINMRVCIKSKQ